MDSPQSKALRLHALNAQAPACQEDISDEDEDDGRERHSLTEGAPGRCTVTATAARDLPIADSAALLGGSDKGEEEASADRGYLMRLVVRASVCALTPHMQAVRRWNEVEENSKRLVRHFML